MKVLTISIKSGGHGAYARQRRLAHALIKDGHEVLWLAPGVDFPGKETFLSFKAGVLLKLGVWGQIPALLLAFWRNNHMLSEVDVIFTFREYDAVACKIWPKLRKVPHVFFQRGDTLSIEKFHIQYSKTLRDKIVRPWTVWLYPRIQRWLFPKLDLVVVQAMFLEKMLRERLEGIHFDTHVLPNDCNIQWSHEQTPPETRKLIVQFKDTNTPLIGLIAPAYWHAKGFDVFLEALKLLRDTVNFKALLIGGGPDEVRIADQIENSRLQECAVFLGRLTGVYDVLDVFDLIVVPTQITDACPNLVLEAMAHETAIVASDIEAHVALLAHSELMFKSGNAVDLARKIGELLRNDQFRCDNKRLVRKQKEVMKFDWDREAASCVSWTAQKNSSHV